MGAIRAEWAGMLTSSTTVRRAPWAVASSTARPLETEEDIRHELVEQLTGSVRWTESVRYMLDQGVRSFVEFGPGTVLTGLIKRIDRKTRRINVANWSDIQSLSGRNS